MFIDEIHRLSAAVKEYLYPAMDGFKVDVRIYQDTKARTISISPFTLVGATDRIDRTRKLSEHFSLFGRLDPYPPEDLHDILRQRTERIRIEASDDALREIASASAGNPADAVRLLEIARDLAEVQQSRTLTVAIAESAIQNLPHGLGRSPHTAPGSEVIAPPRPEQNFWIRTGPVLSSKNVSQEDVESSMSDLHTVRPSSADAPNEVSIGDLRTAQAKSHRNTTAESPGDIVGGKYKITRRLGHGGMGVVYLAVDQKLGREVCVKRLLAGGGPANRGIDLFLQEARSIAAMNHRNIVTVHELGEDERGPFIVMEYLSGGDLRKAIHAAGKLDPAKSLSVIKALGLGLAYAHAKGIIHRDLKPGNVLLDEHGTPTLVDFGLAQMGQESDLIVTGQGMGTMAYMAPEQLRDAKHVDARSDIYSLAKTLYHMLTGEVPTTVDLEMVPPDVRHALRQALKNKPEERPASVAEFLKLFAEPGRPSFPAAITHLG